MNQKILTIQAKMDYDDDFLKKCILKLYERQEEDEQAVRDTTHQNGQGFNKADAKFLTKMASWIIGGLPFSESQQNLADARKRMMKYAGQLSVVLTDQEIN